MTTRQMHINLFMTPAGYHEGSWRVSNSQVEGLWTLPYVARMAQQAERAKFDAVFLADLLSTGGNPNWFRQPRGGMHEPITTMAALAGVTTHIGLIASGSTSFSEPYTLARQFCTIDQLSGGRAGWNIVTSWGGDENYSQPLLDHDERYRRAGEFVDVVTGLWDTWEDDAVIIDREGGYFARPERIHELGHRGDYFAVEGPLNTGRPPQGWPVLVQAGASPVGMKFAAAYAEVVFTQKSTIEDAQSFYAGVKSLVREAGRDPDRVKVLPGLMPIVAETETEAGRIAHELSEFADFEHLRNDLQAHLADLAGLPEFTLEDLALDEPIPQERLIEPSAVQGFQSRYAVFYNLACEGKTLRDSLRVLAGGRGHPVVVGTPRQVANVMEAWFTQGACDGFQLVSPHYFDGLDAITEQLIPELQARGLFRTQYPGTTLRESYGLTRPSGRPTTPIGGTKAGVA